MPEKQEIGMIKHFFPKISVAVVALSADVNKGDRISIEGHGNSFEQTIDSMQIEHQELDEAKAGLEIGLKTAQPVKKNDVVYKV